VPRSERHAEAIAASTKLFEGEAKRFEAELAEQIKKENKARLEAAKRGVSLYR
jgi:hypothetical protein